MGKKLSQAEHYRALAADCEKRAAAADAVKRAEFLRKAKAYRSLADQEEWLAGTGGIAKKPGQDRCV